MQTYRSFRLKDGRISGPGRDFQAVSDLAAIEVARGYSEGNPFEVWQGDRLVSAQMKQPCASG